jgi:hypothetical protein
MIGGNAHRSSTRSGCFIDLFKSRRRLEAENLFLRHKLSIAGSGRACSVRHRWFSRRPSFAALTALPGQSTSIYAAGRGRDFALRKRTVRLDGGEEIIATVPFYEGANLIPTTTTKEMAALVLKASGTSGSCASYVIGIFDKLRAMGIDDPAVTALRLALKSL